MKFTKEASATGRMNVTVGIIIAGALVALQLFVFNRPDVPTTAVVLAWIICGLAGTLFLWQGVMLLTAGGSWEIDVTEHGITWASPHESIDKSFNFTLAELDRTETRIKQKNGKDRPNRDYYLVAKGGNEQKLSPNSGINLVQIITELERLGVRNEVVRG